MVAEFHLVASVLVLRRVLSVMLAGPFEQSLLIFVSVCPWLTTGSH